MAVDRMRGRRAVRDGAGVFGCRQRHAPHTIELIFSMRRSRYERRDLGGEERLPLCAHF